MDPPRLRIRELWLNSHPHVKEQSKQKRHLQGSSKKIQADHLSLIKNLVLLYISTHVATICQSNFSGINKGSAIFLHLLQKLAKTGTSETRRVAFYHRNTSEDRKKEILADLQLPMGSEKKTLLCVVATVSLGIYVHYKYIDIVSWCFRCWCGHQSRQCSYFWIAWNSGESFAGRGTSNAREPAGDTRETWAGFLFS